MKYAIISDVHSNLDALKLVLNDIEDFGVDEIYSLGDCTGYGLQPNEVIQLLIDKGVKSVIGNHDDALCNSQTAFDATDYASRQLRLNKKLIDTQSLSYLKSLPVFISEHDMRMVHGMPPNDISEYVSFCPAEELVESFGLFKERVAFVGHTHLLGIYQLVNDRLEVSPFDDDIFNLKDDRAIINVGSVGLPRDDDERPGYVIYDREKNQIVKRRVSAN